MTLRESQFLRLLGAGFGLARHPNNPPTIARPDVEDARAALERASSLRLDALVAIALRALGYDDDVTDAKRRLNEAKGRAAYYAHASAEVARRLAGKGIRAVIVKGVVNDDLFYGGRGLRGGSDVDVLVDDLHGAVDALGDISIGRPYQERRPRLITARKIRDVSARIAGRVITIDIQGLWLYPPLVDDTHGVLDRRVMVGATPRASLEDIAVYLGGDVVSDRFAGREKLALDMAGLLARDDVNWTVVAQRALAARAGGALWSLLDLAVKYFDARAPAGLMSQVKPPMPRRALLLASARGAPIAGAFTRGFETDSLWHGALHFARYLPSRLLDRLLDEPRSESTRKSRRSRA